MDKTLRIAQPILTADIVLLSADQHVLLIKRRKWPFADQWALPGGKLNQGESPKMAVQRELREKIGVKTSIGQITLTQYRVYSTPDRDPRGLSVSTVYVAIVADTSSITICAGDDAQESQWFSLSALPALAFDHATILRDVLQDHPHIKLAPEQQIAYQFEFAKLDYERLSTQEQNIMNRRGDLWSKVAAILAVPAGIASWLGLKSAIYPLMVIPFLVACLSLEVKHDEQVARYDLRKPMKKLAMRWGFKNHDAWYSEQKQAGHKRWWAGFYKPGRAAALVLLEIVSAIIACWFLWSAGQPALSIVIALLDGFFTFISGWCML